MVVGGLTPACFHAPDGKNSLTFVKCTLTLVHYRGLVLFVKDFMI